MSDRIFNVRRPEDYGKDNLLARVREGMDVYDSEGKRVGKVEQIYMGSVGDTAAASGAEPRTIAPADVQDGTPLPDKLIAGFTRDRDLPDVVRDRLLHNGFMRVDGHGLIGSERLVERQQIESVSGDRVTLNTRQSDLIKR